MLPEVIFTSLPGEALQEAAQASYLVKVSYRWLLLLEFDLRLFPCYIWFSFLSKREEKKKNHSPDGDIGPRTVLAYYVQSYGFHPYFLKQDRKRKEDKDRKKTISLIFFPLYFYLAVDFFFF